MEKENQIKQEKEFKQTRLVIVLVAIIVILVFVIGILLGSRINNKPQTNAPDKIEEKTEKEEKKEEPALEKEDTSNKDAEEKPVKKVDEKKLVKEAQTLIPFHMCGYPAMPLNKKDITIDQLDKKVKAQMIIGKYTNMDIDNPVHIKEEELTKYFADLTFLDYLKKDSDNQYELSPSILTYSKGEYIIETYATGCEGAYEGDVIKYVDYKLEDDNLTLIYAYYWETYNYEGNYSTYYKGKDEKVIFDKVTADEKSEEYRPLYKGKELYYDDFNKYEFTFDISNDNLRLQKIAYKEV